MGKPLFLEKLLAGIAGTLLLTVLFLPRAFCQDADILEAGIHNQQGMEYFKKGFYDHAPKNQGEEAQKNYSYAVSEFKTAIAKDSSFTEAHRNLARLYYVQKNFAGAAEEYKKVTELTPGDLDAYVNLALALIELQRLDEVILALEDARGQTFDPKALTTLDSSLAKVRVLHAREVR